MGDSHIQPLSAKQPPYNVHVRYPALHLVSCDLLYGKMYKVTGAYISHSGTGFMIHHLRIIHRFNIYHHFVPLAQEPAVEILNYARASGRDDAADGRMLSRCPVLSGLERASIKKSETKLNI